jgi:hypothetical protein
MSNFSLQDDSLFDNSKQRKTKKGEGVPTMKIELNDPT